MSTLISTEIEIAGFIKRNYNRNKSTRNNYALLATVMVGVAFAETVKLYTSSVAVT